MAYGGLLRYLILHTREHGDARLVQDDLSFFVLTLSFFLVHMFSKEFLMQLHMQKIKNPNYKGKWKIPWIDNPGGHCDVVYLLYLDKNLRIVSVFSNN